MMKKIFLPLLLVAFFTAPAFARDKDDFEIAGRVSEINQTDKIFTLDTVDGKKFKMAVTPSTEIEYAKKFFDSAKFFDIRIGEWVKVEYYPGDKINTAKEIKIYPEDK